MPVGPGKYRVTTKGGKKVRLHITPSGKINETKVLPTKGGKPAPPAPEPQKNDVKSGLGRIFDS